MEDMMLTSYFRSAYTLSVLYWEGQTSHRLTSGFTWNTSADREYDVTIMSSVIRSPYKDILTLILYLNMAYMLYRLCLGHFRLSGHFCLFRSCIISALHSAHRLSITSKKSCKSSASSNMEWLKTDSDMVMIVSQKTDDYKDGFLKGSDFLRRTSGNRK